MLLVGDAGTEVLGVLADDKPNVTSPLQVSASTLANWLPGEPDEAARDGWTCCQEFGKAV